MKTTTFFIFYLDHTKNLDLRKVFTINTRENMIKGKKEEILLFSIHQVKIIQQMKLVILNINQTVLVKLNYIQNQNMKMNIMIIKMIQMKI